MKPETVHVLRLDFRWQNAIQRTSYTHSTPVKNMCVDHRCFHIFVAK